VTSLLHGLLSLRGWLPYLIVGSLCFGESALLLGFVLPGEVAVVYGGVLASEGHVSLLWMTTLVVAAAILGYTTGYAAGKYLGPVLLRHRPLKGSKGVERTRGLLQRRGAAAVFFGRFVSVFRALAPGMAGMAEVRYPTFVFFNVLSAVTWGIGYSLGGYLAGKSYKSFLSVAGTAGTAALAAAIVAAVCFFLWKKRRRGAAAHDAVQAASEPVDWASEKPE
jgi:membrane-associated protein